MSFLIGSHCVALVRLKLAEIHLPSLPRVGEVILEIDVTWVNPAGSM